MDAISHDTPIYAQTYNIVTYTDYYIFISPRLSTMKASLQATLGIITLLHAGL